MTTATARARLAREVKETAARQCAGESASTHSGGVSGVKASSLPTTPQTHTHMPIQAQRSPAARPRTSHGSVQRLLGLRQALLLGLHLQRHGVVLVHSPHPHADAAAGLGRLVHHLHSATHHHTHSTVAPRQQRTTSGTRTPHPSTAPPKGAAGSFSATEQTQSHRTLAELEGITLVQNKRWLMPEHCSPLPLSPSINQAALLPPPPLHTSGVNSAMVMNGSISSMTVSAMLSLS